jgi:hypothetical protein
VRKAIHSSSERGVALIAALLFAVTVMAFTASVLLSGRALQEHRRSLVAAQMAQDAAESGVHELVAALNSPLGGAIRAAGFAEGTLRGTTERAQRYEVRLRAAGSDAADNDLDGKVDEEDEADMVEVTSTGFADGVVRTVRVTLLARYVDPKVGSATYIADPLADMKLNGNAFLISGVDVTAARVPTGLRVPGIGVAGDPAWIKAQISKQQSGNVVGSGGVPSVYQVSALDLRELIDAGARAANVTLPSGSAIKPSAPGAWGTLEAPCIAYGTGSVHISGGAQGAGILIVDGDLKITGGFQWYGLVIVRGEIVFAGGGGGKMVTGAVIVEKDLRTGTTSNEIELTISGTVDILFSKQTIAAVMKQFATYTIVNWREGPNPQEAMP